MMVNSMKIQNLASIVGRPFLLASHRSQTKCTFTFIQTHTPMIKVSNWNINQSVSTKIIDIILKKLKNQMLANIIKGILKHKTESNI